MLVLSMRAARFTASPMMVRTMRFTPPTSPTPTAPVLMPIPTRNSSEPSASRSWLCSRNERSMASPARTASAGRCRRVEISRDRTVARISIPAAGTGIDRTSHRELALLRGELIPAAFAGEPARA